jgi:hypothetical protein
MMPFLHIIIYTIIAKVMYEKGPDEILCAMHICLDFVNLLVDIMDVLRQEDK